MGDFCLDCDWVKAFTTTSHILSSQKQASRGDSTPDQPVTLSSENRGMEDVCCTADECSVNCPSVCDGFINCDESTVCSQSHCDDENCVSTTPACCDKNCFADDHPFHHLDAFLSQTGLDWEGTDFFTDPSLPHSAHPTSALTYDESHRNNSFEFSSPAIDSPFSSFPSGDPITQESQFFHNHQSGNALMQKSSDDIWTSLHSAAHNFDMNPFSVLGSQSALSARNLTKSVQDRFPCFAGNGLEPCSDAGYLHYGCYVKNTGDKNLQQLEQPENTHLQHRSGCFMKRLSRTATPTPKASRSVSDAASQFLQTPANISSSLVGGHTSHLTTPSSVTEEGIAHICQWTLTRHGKKALCGLIFSSPEALQEHLSSAHMAPLEGTKGPGYYCRWLGCHRQDDPFSQKSKLQGHFLTHSNLKSFNCSRCGKPFARQATLERHERSHRGEKPYQCKLCGKAFTDGSELKTHSRTHTGEKPFKCNYPGCKFQTGDSSNLSSHKLTHGERKHRCTFPGCTKSFTRTDQLKRHQKTTHKHDFSIPGQLALSIEAEVKLV